MKNWWCLIVQVFCFKSQTWTGSLCDIQCVELMGDVVIESNQIWMNYKRYMQQSRADVSKMWRWIVWCQYNLISHHHCVLFTMSSEKPIANLMLPYVSSFDAGWMPHYLVVTWLCYSKNRKNMSHLHETRPWIFPIWNSYLRHWTDLN